jgi:hypothetical protein
MQRLMGCPLRELFLAHDEVFLDRVCTFEADQAYCIKVSIDQVELGKRLTVAR